MITGIWDVMTNEEVVEFVRNAIAEGDLPDTVSTIGSSIRVYSIVLIINFRSVRI